MEKPVSRYLPLFLAVLALWLVPLAAARADGSVMSGQEPLTQADIDAYIYFTPRLAGEAGRNPGTASRIIRESGLTRKRALYVSAKIVVTQAMTIGALTPGQLVDENVLPALHPTAEEISLVNSNRTTLEKAQAAARRAGGDAAPAIRGNQQ